MTAKISNDSAVVGAAVPTVSVDTPVPAGATIGPVTWTSSDVSVATITPAGVIALVGAGSATFTATETATSVKDSVDLTVTV